MDVIGGSNIKKYYGEKALAVFIQPPSLIDLENRLLARSTDCPEMIRERIAKAEHELTYVNLFDIIIINDKLKNACQEAEVNVRKFLNKSPDWKNCK